MYCPKYTQADFAINPLMFYYEVTQACDLVCRHCRACAQARSHPDELTTVQSKELIDQIATFPRRPTLVITGGDPLKRADLFELVRHAVAAGLQVALTPSATPLATRQALATAKDAGVQRLGISLDGADARTHDAFRGWHGSFDRTLHMLADARELGLPVQINTTITRRNFKQIDTIAHLLATQGIVMWSVFFLVPVGRGVAEKRIAPEEYEQAFERLWIHSQRQPYGIKTTEAPHYRRYVLQRGSELRSARALGIVASHVRGSRAPLGVRDGNGIMFVGHTGEIYPAGFLPILCGRFPTDGVVDVYQNHPTFRALRDPDRFGGDCGICEYRHVCGGSRSRALAVTGDPLAAEPDCIYQPRLRPGVESTPGPVPPAAIDDRERLRAYPMQSAGRFKRTLLGTMAMLLGCVSFLVCRNTVANDTSQPLDFSRDIRPILTEKCLGCHGGDEPEGDLRLGDRDAALGKGSSGLVAIVPRKPHESELIRRIQTADAEERMPPEDEEPLTADEIDKLQRWIAEGATWSVHWAFQPLSDSAPPDVENKGWIRNDIDCFVLARLEQNKLTPAPEADRYALIKRLYYDLIGLPPPVEIVDAFVTDESEDAYEALLERLLDSPHFGERWGRHWLDLAHFADSDGYEKDRARPDAHVYRDWVIEAINDDMPYDQFTIAQLAGDLLPHATAKQRIATGFLRQTLTNEEGGVDQEEFRVAACFDRTETVGTVWLGLTIGCVRCHKHKYDPIAHEEFYKLFAFFNNAEEVKTRLPVAADNVEELERELQPLEESLAARYAELAPRALEWETTEHKRIVAQREGPLKELGVEILSVQSEAAPGTVFDIRGDQVFVVGSRSEPPTVPDKDVYTVAARVTNSDVTGFKLHVMPDERLPSQGPGHAPNGNFVLTGFQVFLVSEKGDARPVELHRAKADFSQQAFAPEGALEDDENGPTGWAVADQTGAAHWIQFRIREPLKLTNGASLKFVLSQQYGGRHVLGHFRLAVLTGDERGLHLSNESIAGALEMYPEKRVADMKQQLFDYFVAEVACDEVALGLQRQIAAVHQKHEARLMEVRTLAKPRLPRTTHVFHRGDFLSPKDAVQPGMPAILTKFQPRAAEGDRLDLACWLVGRENFLAPRVAVNHVWRHLFGQGLVRTPNDFGTRGEPPTHPQLLDWLALRFQGDLKWSRKELIRLLVTSATYRQSSHFRPELEKQDPLNMLLFRQNRFRVESEIVRDLHLAVAGLLSPRIGGPSVFPPMPEDLAKLSYADNFSWKNSQGADRYCRGMYTFFKRTIPHPNLMTFDSPDANVACIARTVSNTPLQALTLLNNEVHIEAAQALAKRVIGTQPSAVSDQEADKARLSYALRLCVARPPTDMELSSLANVLNASRDYYAQHEDEAGQMVSLHTPHGVPPAEAAAWVAAVRIALNLDEFVTRE